jgi:hypothetical protein
VVADKVGMADTVVTAAVVDVAKVVPVAAVADVARVVDPAVRAAVQADLAAASGSFFVRKKSASFASRKWI